MPDGDWERKTVSEKHSDVAQRGETSLKMRNKISSTRWYWFGQWDVMWVKQACQLLSNELCIPNPSSVRKLHSSLIQCGSHEHPDHNQPSRVCPTANCSAFVTASQTHASDQLGLFATTQMVTFHNLKTKKEKKGCLLVLDTKLPLIHGVQQHVLHAMLCWHDTFTHSGTCRLLNYFSVGKWDLFTQQISCSVTLMFKIRSWLNEIQTKKKKR